MVEKGKRFLIRVRSGFQHASLTRRKSATAGGSRPLLPLTD